VTAAELGEEGVGTIFADDAAAELEDAMVDSLGYSRQGRWVI
jgi:hypothetical protein